MTASAASDLEDALNPRMAGSTAGMTLQVLAQIRDSLTSQNRDIRSTVEAIGDVRERVIRLEESNRRLEAVEAVTKVQDAKIDALLKDKDRRDGAVGMLGTIKSWAPFLAMLFSAACAAWLYGRSLGITPAPPVRVEAVAHPEQHKIEGTIGGRP